MKSLPPFPTGPGGRVLAAIIFTDVVSFSAHVQSEEDSTLGALEWDFEVMKTACEKYSGTVVKSTGDGLLLYFSSAVHAVSCAIRIQRTFAERARSEKGGVSLTHRIGVHLGDVFPKDEDVMGHGVNVAARLQALADPGGICISQTVYDVVKNRLKLDVERLAARELKNVSNIGTLYRVLLEPRAAASTPVDFRRAEPVARSVFSPTEKLLAKIALALALPLGAFLLYRANVRHEQEAADSDKTRAALGSLTDAAANPAPSDAGPASAQGPEAEEESNIVRIARDPAIERGLTDSQKTLTAKRAADYAARVAPWVSAAMAHHREATPMQIKPLLTDLTVSLDQNGRFVVGKGGASMSPQDWEKLDVEVQAALIVGLLRETPAPQPRDAVLAAYAFAYQHKLPAMASALPELK